MNVTCCIKTQFIKFCIWQSPLSKVSVSYFFFDFHHKKAISPNLASYWCLERHILGRVHQDASQVRFPGKNCGMQVLPGLASSNQTVGKSIQKYWQKVSFTNSIQWKKALNYFWSNAFCKVKHLTNLSTTFCCRTLIRIPSQTLLKIFSSVCWNLVVSRKNPVLT